MTQTLAVTERSRLAIVASSVSQLERNCQHIVQLALERQNAVLCLAPGLPIGVAGSGPMAGASLAHIDTSIADGPHLSRQARGALDTIFRDWRPDTALAAGIAALPITRRTAWRAGLRHVSCLVFEEPALPADGLFRRIAQRRAIRAALKHCHKVLLADPSLTHNFRDVGLPVPEQAALVVPGAGADIATAGLVPLPGIDEGIRLVTFAEPDDAGAPDFWRGVQRLLDDRGHGIVIALVRLVPTTWTGVTQTSDAVEEGGVDDANAGRGDLEIIDTDASGMARAIAQAHVAVPIAGAQLFGVGTMAALAAGRPLLALDTPAHRRVIDERVNGVLLRNTAPETVVSSIENLLRRPDLFPSMARAGRAKAERHFDCRELAARVLDALDMR